MRTTLFLVRIGLTAVVLSLTLASAGAAQEVIGPGTSLTILIPIDALASSRQIVTLSGAPKSAITVGDCMPGEFRPQGVQIADAAGDVSATTSEIIVIEYGYRNQPVEFNGLVLELGTRLGSFRGGGECGPGYAGYVAHVLVPADYIP